MLAALRGRRRRGARAARAARPGARRSATAIVEALRAHPAARPRRAGRLGAAPGRRASRTSTSSPPPPTRRRCSAALAELDVDRERARAGRERGAGAHPHRRCASTCGSSRPTSSATCCSTSPAPRSTTWRCARRRCGAGLHVSEYGVLDDATGETHRCATEEEVYALLGLPWIPPELREDRGELGAAAAATLPELIEQARPQAATCTCHTTPRDGRDNAEEMARRARASCGLEYLAITDHSATHGFGNDVTPDALRAPDRGGPRGQRALDGIGCSSAPRRTSARRLARLRRRPAGPARLGRSARSTRRSRIGGDEMTERMVAAIEHPLVDAIGHLTGRKIERRAPYAVDVERRLRGGRAHRDDARDQLGARPPRPRRRPRARRRRGRRADRHRLRRPRPRHLIDTRWGIATARRAWLTTADVANTLPWAEFAPLRKRARSSSRGSSCARARPVDGGAAVRRERRQRALGVAGRAGRRARRAAPAPGRRRRGAGRARGRAAARRRARRRASSRAAAVGERLELGDAVVLAPRRGHEHARAAQQRAVLAGRERPGGADARARAARARCRSTTSSSPSRRAAAHAASTRSRPFLSRVGGVGDGGDVALGRRRGPEGSTGIGDDDRGRVRRGDSASVPGAWGRAAAPRAGAGARAGAARARGGRGGWRPRARRSGSRRAAATAAPPSSSSRRRRAGACSAIPRRAAARAARAQTRSVSASVRTSRGGRRRDHGDARAGALERRRELGVGGAQAGRRAERDEEDLGHGGAQRVPLTDVSVGTSRRRPGVRTSCIGRTGEVRST